MAAPAPVILHIATEAEWVEAQRVGEVHPPSLEHEGFVHCSTDEQLADTLARHFAGRRDLVVLRIDVGRADAELRWEASGGTERFPHLYGPVPVAAVVGVEGIG